MFRRIHGLVGELAGVPPKGNRAPAWDLMPHTAEILLDLGLVYDSSLMGNDYSPYYVRRGYEMPQGAPMRFGEETRLVEMPVSWSLDDYPHYEYLRLPNAIMPGLKTPEDVFRNWTEDVAYMVRDFTARLYPFGIMPLMHGNARAAKLHLWGDAKGFSKCF